MALLVVYSTLNGATEGIAGRIADQLAQSGAKPDLRGRFGDHRQWTEIDAWAEKIGQALSRTDSRQESGPKSHLAG